MRGDKRKTKIKRRQTGEAVKGKGKGRKEGAGEEPSMQRKWYSAGTAATGHRDESPWAAACVWADLVGMLVEPESCFILSLEYFGPQQH
jgi:hypothetical protein